MTKTAISTASERNATTAVAFDITHASALRRAERKGSPKAVVAKASAARPKAKANTDRSARAKAKATVRAKAKAQQLDASKAVARIMPTNAPVQRKAGTSHSGPRAKH